MLQGPGADGVDRTPDLGLTRTLLCRLSYASKNETGKNEQTDGCPLRIPEGRRLHGHPSRQFWTFTISNSPRPRPQKSSTSRACRRASSAGAARTAHPDRQGSTKRQTERPRESARFAAFCRFSFDYRAILPSCRLAEGPVGPPPLTLVFLTLVRVASLSGAWNRARTNAANRSADWTAVRRRLARTNMTVSKSSVPLGPARAKRRRSRLYCHKPGK